MSFNKPINPFKKFKLKAPTWKDYASEILEFAWWELNQWNKPVADGTPPPNAVPIPPVPTDGDLVDTDIVCRDRPPTPVLREPPKYIYQPPDINIGFEINFPPLPPRSLPTYPPISSTNTSVTYSSNVEGSLADHKFGCMLARPFYTEPYVFCLPPIEDPITLINRIMDGILLYLQELEEGLAVATTERLALTLLPLPYFAKPMLLIGTQNILAFANWYQRRSEIISQMPRTGMVGIKGVQFINCPPREYYTEEDIDELDFSITTDECAIPLSMYNDMEGYKGDQLQIIWRNQGYSSSNQYPKSVVLPSPRPIGDYSEELFRSVLPQWRYSGLTKVDIEVQGKIPEDRIDEGEGFDEAVHGACERWRRELPIFTPYITKEEVETFIEQDYKTWIQQLCTEDVRVTKFVTKGYSSIDIKETWCYPYRAVYMGWDATGKRWVTKAHWYIYKRQPDEAPPED